jgi:methionyl-tRNA formyltransferase
MKVVFLGSTKYSETLLLHLLEIGVELVAIASIPEQFSISYSSTPVRNTNFADLKQYSKQLNIPHYEVDSVKGKRLQDYGDAIKALNPDVILVLGWYYMLPERVREIARLGAWGIHASLLPKYAGGAPLVWAMINGESTTGVTLFRFENGVDDGDIIAQEAFEIEEVDTIKEVYNKATIVSMRILTKVFKTGNFNFHTQNKAEIQVFPQRSPDDGEIDFSWEKDRIFDFIRAQTNPYPGAFLSNSKGRKLFIKEIKIL